MHAGRTVRIVVLLFLAASFLQAQTRPRVAVVLSGGSALGLAHVGVLKVIERAGIPIDMILGTSMGSIVGGLYASGYSPEQMESIVTTIDWGTVFSERRDSPGDRYDWLKRQKFSLRLGVDGYGLHLGAGLLDGQNVLALFTQLTLQDLTTRDFDSLPVPYRAVAADIMTGEKVVLSRGSIAEAMRSSMSIPGVFRPYDIEGRRVVDGGIADNMPVDVARDMGADIVIAVECRTANPKSADALGSSLAITAQTLNLFIQQNMAAARKNADILITPDLHDFDMMSYGEATRIVRRGETGALSVYPALEQLASRIKSARPLVRPEEQANRRAFRQLPVLDAIQVEGGSGSDQALARSAFTSLLGKSADRLAVRKAIDAVYASGRFDLVTLDLAPAAESGDGIEHAVVIVRLTPDTTANDAIFFGQSFRALFTTITDNESQVMAGAELRDLTGKDSALYAEAGFLDRRRFFLEYFQPFGPFFMTPFFKYESQFDGYFITSSDIFKTLYQTVGGGAWAGFTLDKHADVMAGYSYESVLAYGFADPSTYNTVGTVSGVLRIDTFRTSVFPESGFSTVVRGRWADPVLGGNTGFTALEWNVNAAVPLSKTITIGAVGYAATDFTGFVNGSNPIPAERAFSIRQPGMFYGLEPQPAMGEGDNVAALALELRAKLGRLSPLLGVDIFGIANVSAAVVRQGVPGDIDFINFLPVRWDASLGLGARITERLGIMAVASYVNDGNTTLSPQRFALTFEAGTFSQFLEDRR